MTEKSKKFNIIFAGTPDFALPSLKSFLNHPDFSILGIITQPDKKVGRKQIITSSPIKQEALKNNIAVWQPEKIKNFSVPLAEIDFIVVIAYGQIIPKNILDLPRYGCINVHGSLLPKYRGAACIKEAIINGDPESGVTIMKMDEGLDTGPILAQAKISINQNDTSGDLYDKISNLGAEILIPTLIKYANGEIKPIAQDNSKSSYVGLVKKNDGEIDWTKPASAIERFIRAMQPWPGAFCRVENQNSKVESLKLIKVKIAPIDVNDYKPGNFFIANNELAVQCGKGALIIEKIQPVGKNVMDAKSFINGYRGLIFRG